MEGSIAGIPPSDFAFNVLYFLYGFSFYNLQKMNNAEYGYRKKVSYDFNTAVEKITASLKDQGFGIISQINITEKIKEKLDEEFIPYVILGACNPKLAFKALQTETEIGLLLPCNVIVYEKDDAVFISSILPSVGMSFVENSELKCIAEEVEPKLKKSIDNC